MKLENHFQIREMNERDKKFVYKTTCNQFVRCICGNERHGYEIQQYLYHRVTSKLTENFSKDVYLCMIVFNINDPDQIIAYLIKERNTNNCVWLYVKHDFRSMGIAKWLANKLLDLKGCVNYPIESVASFHYKRTQMDTPFVCAPLNMEHLFSKRI